MTPPARYGAIQACAAALAAACGCGVALADVQHTVVAGDTLSSLATRYLGDAAYWVKLRAANPGVRERYLVPGTTVTVPAPAPGSGATVVHVSGQAFLVRLGLPRELAKDMEVRETDVVEVRPGGYVTLKWPDGVVTHLLPASKLRLSGARSLELLNGAAESSVPRENPPRNYRIRTRWGVAGVRGTQFGVRLLPSGSMATDVTEGAVELAGSTFKPVQLAAGTGAVAGGPQRQPQASPLLAAPALQERFVLTPEAGLRAGAVSGAAAYELVIGTDAQPPVPLSRAESATPVFTLPPLPDGNYSVTVRAVDAQGIPGQPAARPLQVLALASPLLSEPPIDAVLPEGSPARLLCSEVPRAGLYEFQVSSGGRPSPRPPASARCETLLPALPAGTYEWTANAAIELPGGGVLRGATSQTGRFSVVARPAAPTVRLAGGQDLRLMWDGAPDARYIVQVARDLAFTSLVSETMVEVPQASLSVPAGQAFYVRIKTLSGAGIASDFSPPRIVRGPQRLGTSDGGPVHASDGTPVEPP